MEILKNVLQKLKRAQLQNISVLEGVSRVTEMNTLTSTVISKGSHNKAGPRENTCYNEKQNKPGQIQPFCLGAG